MEKRILIVQENGRHDKNRDFRECFALQRAFTQLGVAADVWGLGHDSFKQPFAGIIDRYAAVISLENYDSGWQPDYSKVRILKSFWCIDAHMGMETYQQLARRSKFDLIFNSTENYLKHFADFCGQSLWLPNAYDSFLVAKHPEIPKNVPIGFCGNTGNRSEWISYLTRHYGLHHDEMILGADMVHAINGYQIHWNRNIADDINYRTFETLGCGTFLLTNHTPGLDQLFSIDEHLAIYRNKNELDEKLHYYGAHPRERELIAQAGHDHVKQNHSYVQRAESLLQAFGMAETKSSKDKSVPECSSSKKNKPSGAEPAAKMGAAIDTARDLVRAGEWLGCMVELERETCAKAGQADFSGSAIERPLFEWVVRNLPPGSTILEFGSGSGSTKNFSRFYKMYSVEDKIEFVGLYDSTYIHAPIRDGWYDLDILRRELPCHYDLILVDGPTGEGNRWGFYHQLALFNTRVPIVFDDTLRKAEMDMMLVTARDLGKTPRLFGEGVNFGVVM